MFLWNWGMQNIQDAINSYKEISGNIVFTKIKLLLKNVLPYFIDNVSCEK